MPPIYDFICDPDKCEKEESTSFMCSYDDLPKKPKCEHCGKEDIIRSYGIGMTKVSYEKNGRKAVRVDVGGHRGKAERSMTRENHLNGKGTKSVYTKEYQNRLDKAAAEKVKENMFMAKKARESRS